MDIIFTFDAEHLTGREGLLALAPKTLLPYLCLPKSQYFFEFSCYKPAARGVYSFRTAFCKKASFDR
jgi:hypothetical protein